MLTANMSMSLTRISLLQTDGVRWATKRLGIPVRSAPNTAEAVLTVKRSKPRQWVDSVEGSNPRTQLADECDSGLFTIVWYLIERRASVATAWQQTFTDCTFICQNGNMSDKLRCTECMDFKYLAPSRSAVSLHFSWNSLQAFKQLKMNIWHFLLPCSAFWEIGPSGSSIARQCVETCPINTFHLGAAWQMMASGWFWPIWFKRELPRMVRLDGSALIAKKVATAAPHQHAVWSVPWQIQETVLNQAVQQLKWSQNAVQQLS